MAIEQASEYEVYDFVVDFTTLQLEEYQITVQIDWRYLVPRC